MPGAVPGGVLDAARTDAAARTGIEAAALTIVRAEPATWSDGSRGCPQPGMTYTQAIVEGYWVVVDAGGTTVDYRISRSGDLRRCERFGRASSAP